jgi:hypothetical protein
LAPSAGLAPSLSGAGVAAQTIPEPRKRTARMRKVGIDLFNFGFIFPPKIKKLTFVPLIKIRLFH